MSEHGDGGEVYAETDRPEAAKLTMVFDEDRNTHLHLAAARGDNEEVLRLVDAGHKVDAENELGWTALMMATRNGHVDVIKLLLERRADATRKNKFGGSIFLMAIATGNLDIVHTILQHLLCGGVSRQCMETYFSPLSIAILFEHEKVFTYLLEKGFNQNIRTPMTGLTPSMYAAISDNQTFINILVSKGADQTVKNINNETAEELLQEASRKRGLLLSNSNTSISSNTSSNGGIKKHVPPPLPPLEIPKIVMFNASPQYLTPVPPPPAPAPTPTYIPIGRKCSNVLTPNFCISPNMSPISPIVFFPSSEFSPHIIGHHAFNYPNPAAYPQQLSPMITFAYQPPNESILYHEHNATLFDYHQQTMM